MFTSALSCLPVHMTRKPLSYIMQKKERRKEFLDSVKEYRVKYFPPNDFACGLKIEKIEQIYKNKDLQIIHDINDAIEFYNLYLYFHNDDLIWKKWSKQQVDVFKSFTEELKTESFK